MSAFWSLDDIEWSRFDPETVDPELLRITKGAALVEFNGTDYTEYLCNVFSDDPVFRSEAERWGREEVQHGEALARWATLADPAFDFNAAFRRFTEGYRIAVDSDQSVRGSRSGELIARCIVETGTSTFYASLAEISKEPVLSEIVRRIAADELRHYKLFYTALKRYLEKESLGTVGRLRAAFGRIGELEDDELAYAYYAANVPAETPYDRVACVNASFGWVYAHCDTPTLRRANSMVLKAVGLAPHGVLNRVMTAGMRRLVDRKARQYADAA